MRIALRHVYYHIDNTHRNRLAVQVQCMRQGTQGWDDPEGWDGEGGGRGVS